MVTKEKQTWPATTVRKARKPFYRGPPQTSRNNCRVTKDIKTEKDLDVSEIISIFAARLLECK